MSATANWRPGDGARAGHNPWLDLVRAMAITLVLLRHGHRGFLPAADAGAVGFWQTLFANGWVGVDIFLVLSGYLISRHLIRHGLGTERFVFSRYIAMRALRIVPAYLAVLTAILIAAFPFYPVDTSYLGLRVLYHLLFLQDYLPSNINVVFWSLGVEEKFYLIAPVLIWFALSRKTLWIAILALVSIIMLTLLLRLAAYAYSDATFDYETFFRLLRSPFHASLEPLMIGVAIALVHNAGLVRPSPVLGRCIFTFALGALIVWLGSHEFMLGIDAFDVTAQPTLIAGLAGLLTLGAVQMDTAAMPCEAAIRTVARLSYCLYLVHYPLLPLSKAIADASAFPEPAFWLCYLALSFAIAGLLHVGVERPFLRLKDQMAGRLVTVAQPS
jgi:peptidoglycan/LPS O-acetylase OafA/YrhL